MPIWNRVLFFLVSTLILGSLLTSIGFTDEVQASSTRDIKTTTNKVYLYKSEPPLIIPFYVQVDHTTSFGYTKSSKCIRIRLFE